MKKTSFKKLKDGSIRIPIRVVLPSESRHKCKNKIATLFKSAALLLIFSLNWTGLFAIGQTLAYYSDTEGSSDNAFTAASLDFALSSYEYESPIGLDETISKSSVLVNSGGMDFQYTLEAEEISDEDNFCGALSIQAKLNGVEKYDGNLMSLDGAGGFTDEEKMSFILTAGKMVVLNEFLPRPDGVAYGFDFGNDASDIPQGEWIEIYNNSTESIDVAGWYTRDATDGEGNKVVITALNTSPATTIIGGKSWLVVYMNKPILNNTGDTVRLFDAENNLIDSHSYDDPDFCEIEPSPGEENSTDASGSCGSVPPNKSYARIPDGIGAWVDPIPTPGRTNKIAAAETDESLPDSVISLGAEPVIENAMLEVENTTEPMADEPEESLPMAEEETISAPEETVEALPTEEPIAEDIVLPTDENSETPADMSETISEEPAAVEEENVTGQTEAVETIPTSGETSPAEPENITAEEPPQPPEEEAIEPPKPVEIVEPPQEEPTPEPPLEPSNEGLTGQATI
ncbi:MAG: hypothetical protein UX07_C0045G0002 [Parcubacteria group bacterium GW2011_GWA2_45_30]|nr:MAG: hypothetical protein UX07_C0045G0002 [Parcubacteria group bacterium GW2011_GWA2_45_30]